MTEVSKKTQKWSYSRVNTFKTCPRLYELHYIYKIETEDNAFSQYGQVCHNILEKYAKGELDLKELLKEFDYGFETFITKQFPDSFVDLAQRYYQDGERFFKEFNGFKDETISVEDKIDFIIKRDNQHDDINFTGIIDRLSQDGDTYIITDYKSKGKFKTKKEQSDYFKQLYMYALALKDKVEISDDNLLLRLSLFRLQKDFLEKFNPDVAESIKQDFIDMVDKIDGTTEYPPNVNSFFCLNLCGVPKMNCEFREEKSHENNSGISLTSEGKVR
jgi:RecB family exonuclease